ncbi:unnamed protein product [Thelazia callipaeda]|uniref:Uncharacterized protein n=1 Tax=Thelazia callipaeda TaxID=103827 RepID=A0A0N5DAF2_THECL|nr:unnamed protein product [Thelazia callipaeda]
MKLRDTLINMLGEFIGLHKTPDFKLNLQSSHAIFEAAIAETKKYSMSVDSDIDYTVHRRAYSLDGNYDGGTVNMDPSCRRSSESMSFSSFTPSGRCRQQQLPAHPQKKKRAHIHNSLNAFFKNGNFKNKSENFNNCGRTRRHTRRGSETFCGSIAAYSNNLSTINTRL